MRQAIALILLFSIFSTGVATSALNAHVAGELVCSGLLTGVDAGCSVAADFYATKADQHMEVAGRAAGSVGDMLSKLRDPFISRNMRVARFAADAFRTLTYASLLNKQKEKQEEPSNQKVLLSTGLRLVGALANLYALSKKERKPWAWACVISSFARAGADCVIGNNTIRFGSLLSSAVDAYAMLEVLYPKVFIQRVDNCQICQCSENDDAPFDSQAFECSLCHKKIHADCYENWMTSVSQAKEVRAKSAHPTHWERASDEKVEINGHEYFENSGSWWRHDASLVKKDSVGNWIDMGWLYIKKPACGVCGQSVPEKDYYGRLCMTVK